MDNKEAIGILLLGSMLGYASRSDAAVPVKVLDADPAEGWSLVETQSGLRFIIRLEGA